MPNQLVALRFSPEDLERLDTLAQRFGVIRSEAIRESIRRAYEHEVPSRLGYVHLDRCAGHCLDCNKPVDSDAYVALKADGTLVGPLCGPCVSAAIGADAPAQTRPPMPQNEAP